MARAMMEAVEDACERRERGFTGEGREEDKDEENEEERAEGEYCRCVGEKRKGICR